MTHIRNLNRLAYFAAVIETGSFTAAAKRMDITKAVVSQQIARLEEEVGTSLVLRTTRRLRPTDSGQLFYDHCVKVLREAGDAFDALASYSTEPAGRLRITAPHDYGSMVVAPVIVKFRDLHPNIHTDLILSDSTLNLLSERLDLAIHVGWLADSSQITRRISSFRQVVVCTPSFAASLPPLTSPVQFAQLPFVENKSLKQPLAWTFVHKNGEQFTVKMTSAMSMDATPAVTSAVLAGGGISVLPSCLVSAEVSKGTLVELLPEWELPSGGIHALFPSARFRPNAVNLFVNLMVEYTKSLPD